VSSVPSRFVLANVVVIAGPGKAKTMVGVKFLPAGERGNQACASVYVSDYSPCRIDRSIRTIDRTNEQKISPNIEPCPLTTGYTEPGHILQQSKIRSTIVRGKERTRFTCYLRTWRESQHRRCRGRHYSWPHRFTG
jgi:hypothetical protein